MDKRTANLIVDAALMIGGMDVEMFEEYSGRGMYGSSTTGVTASNREMLACVAQAAADLAVENQKGYCVEDEDREEYSVEDFVCDVSNLSTDSMGRSVIWY